VLLGDGLLTPEFCRQLPAFFDPIDFGFPAHGGMVVEARPESAHPGLRGLSGSIRSAASGMQISLLESNS
jgi:hypothetical protein